MMGFFILFILFVIVIIMVIWANKNDAKLESERLEKRELELENTELEKIERLKSIYQKIERPILVGELLISSIGTLLSSLSFYIQNISPETVIAIEVVLVYFDAFDNITNSVTLSSKCALEPYNITNIKKRIDRPSEFAVFDVIINKVKFSDGTIWQR